MSTVKKFKIRVDEFKNYDNIIRVNRLVYTLAVQFEMSDYYEKRQDENPVTVEEKVKMLWEICSRHGSNIRIFYISHGEFNRPKDFVDILQCMPLLEKLNLQKMNFKFNENTQSIDQPVAMKHLKKLQVSMTGFDFRLLLGSQPKTLSLINLQRNNVKFLYEFVKTLDKLESLTLSGGVAINMFLQAKSSDFHFKLNKLEIDSSRSIETGNETYITNFLTSQASSLEELSIRDVSSEVVKEILQSLKLLQILTIHFRSVMEQPDSLTSDKSFYDSLQPLTNLREFFIHGSFKDEIAAKGFLQNCPSLVKLVSTQCSGISKIISFIAANNPKIQHLDVYRLMTEIRPDVKFNFLKDLHLTISESEIDNVTTFIKNNPTIERLVIRRSSINPELSISNLVHALVSMPNLKYLEFNSVAIILKAIYSGFAAIQTKREIGLVFLFDRMGRRAPRVQFQFPQDAGQWDEKCAFVETTGVTLNGKCHGIILL